MTIFALFKNIFQPVLKITGYCIFNFDLLNFGKKKYRKNETLI